MSGILDLLNSDMGKTIINGVAQQSGQTTDKTSSVLTMALPVLMGAMKRNAATPDGAQGLMGALLGKHDGSILDNLGDLFNGGVDANVMQDGAGILGHVLGGSQNNVTNALSQKSGIDSTTIMQILQIAAPLVMGYLGKQSKQQNVSNTTDMGDLLGSLLGGGNEAPKQQSLIESVLDGDGDGSILDDVAGMVLNSGNSQKSGLGGLLGGIFGK
ncbi:MAG: DUF937 domain-containing protein [Flavobacteriaceae bacterium]